MTNFDKPTPVSPAGRCPGTSRPVTLPAGSRKLFHSASSSRSTAFGAMRGMLRNLGEFLLKGFLGLIILAAIFYAVWDFANMPEVEVSNASGECVRVVYADGKTGTCNQLPERFDRVWVK